MQQLLTAFNGAGCVSYYEEDGKGHWYNGVLSTFHLRRFYKDVLNRATSPIIPLHFKVVIPNPATMGSRAGLKVEALVTPAGMGFVEIKRTPEAHAWEVQTSNIHAFHFVDSVHREHLPLLLTIDGQSFKFAHVLDLFHGRFHWDGHKVWNACPSSYSFSLHC